MANALNTFLDQAASGGFGSLFLQARDSARRADMNRRAAEEFEIAKKRYPAEFALRQTEVGAKDVTARARAVAADASTVSANTAAEKFRHGSDPSVIQSEHARALARAAARGLRPGEYDTLRDDPTGADYTALQKRTDAGNADQEGSESYQREREKGRAGVANDKARLEANLPIANQGNTEEIIAFRARMSAVSQGLRAELKRAIEFVSPNGAPSAQAEALKNAIARIDEFMGQYAPTTAQPGAGAIQSPPGAGAIQSPPGAGAIQSPPGAGGTQRAPDPAAFNARVGELVGSGMSEEAAIAQAKQEFAR